MTVSPSQFELIAAAQGVLKDDEISQLTAYCDQAGGDGALSGGVALAEYRRSRVAWVKREDGFDWLYDRIAGLAKGFNDRFFGFELARLEKSLQVARYDSAVSGGYDWHTDFSTAEQTRKLSISVQLTDSHEYSGGDIEFDVSTQVTTAGREKGLAVAFPSFVRHRVAPVTAGVRYSLVAWVHGPRWR